MTAVDVEIYDSPDRIAGDDYLLQIKIKNGPLMRAIRMRGFNNVNQFCKHSGLRASTVGQYLLLQRPPINKKGEWRPGALAMAKALRLPPDSLFPEQHLEKALAVSSGEYGISVAEVELLTVADDQDVTEKENIYQALIEHMQNRLTPRQERVLRLRFGFDGYERTLEEVGQKMGGLSRDRIRQIEATALRRLQRHFGRLMDAGYEPPEQFLKNIRWHRNAEMQRIGAMRPSQAERQSVQEAKQQDYEYEVWYRVAFDPLFVKADMINYIWSVGQAGLDDYLQWRRLLGECDRDQFLEIWETIKVPDDFLQFMPATAHECEIKSKEAEIKQISNAIDGLKEAIRHGQSGNNAEGYRRHPGKNSGDMAPC